MKSLGIFKLVVIAIAGLMFFGFFACQLVTPDCIGCHNKFNIRPCVSFVDVYGEPWKGDTPPAMAEGHREVGLLVVKKIIFDGAHDHKPVPGEDKSIVKKRQRVYFGTWYCQNCNFQPGGKPLFLFERAADCRDENGKKVVVSYNPHIKLEVYNEEALRDIANPAPPPVARENHP